MSYFQFNCDSVPCFGPDSVFCPSLSAKKRQMKVRNHPDKCGLCAYI